MVPASAPDIKHTGVMDQSIRRRQLSPLTMCDEVTPTKPKSRKEKPLSVEEQPRSTQHIHPRGRIREAHRVERLGARKLRRRLDFPTPDGPFDPEEGFSESVVRIAKWGKRFLNLAYLVGGGGEKETLTNETYQKRRRLRSSNYMRRFQEYLKSHGAYVQKYRRIRDSGPTADTPWAVFMKEDMIDLCSVRQI